MTPYYQDESVTLYHADCTDLLPMTADVVITDPPYAVKWSDDACRECGNDDPAGACDLCSDCLDAGVDPRLRRTEMLGFISPNWNEKATHSRGYADHNPEAFAALMDASWSGIARSLAPGGIAVAFCGNRTLHEMTSAAERRGFQVVDLLAFIGGTGVAKSTTTLAPGHELAVLMRRPGPKRQINPDWRATNVFQIPKGRMESDHLTTKPIAWMRALVRLVSRPGDVILDPFAGSGSTLRAAKDEGRRAVGIEINGDYCAIAAKRLAQGVLDFGGVT